MFLRSLLIVGLIGFGLIACGPKKASTQLTKEEAQQEYDYRAALQHYKIGINHISNKEMSQAIEALDQAIRLDPSNYRYHEGLGMALAMNGQLDRAESELKKAVEINKSATESYNWLSTVYIDTGRYDDAVTVLKQVIRDDSYDRPQFAYFNLGKCYQAQGRLTEAVAAYTRAVEFDSEFYRAYLALGDIYKEAKDFKGALFYYKKAETNYNNNVDLLFEIGHALFKLKRFDEAKSYLAQVSILFPPPAIDQPTQEMLRYIEVYQRENF